MQQDISELVDGAPGSDDMKIVAKMKMIVPEFRSQHSKYQVLDTPKEGKYPWCTTGSPSAGAWRLPMGAYNPGMVITK